MSSHLDTTEDLLRQNERLRHLAAKLAGRDLSPDDVVQEAWLGAIRTRQPEAVRNGRAWWTILLRNAAHNLRRSGVRRRAREQSAVPPATDSTPGPFDLAVFEERRRDLIAVVETLPPAQRDVVLARYWQGMEPAEIARRNKERPAAVRQRLQRAIDNLRQRLDRRVQSDRAAWLLPLMIGADHAPTAWHGGVVITVGGWMMMKKVLVAIAVVLLLSCGLLVWQPWQASAVVPGETSHPVSLVLPGASADQEVHTDRTQAPHLPASVPPPSTASGRVLLDANGSPVAGVAFWAAGRPFSGHRGTAPEGARTTDQRGRYDVEDLAPHNWLWFQLDEGLSLALPPATWVATEQVDVPRRRQVKVELRSLPAGEPWHIVVYPAYESADGEPEMAGCHVTPLDRSGAAELWLVRRMLVAEGTTAPARATFPLVDGLPHSFGCSATGYEMVPANQEAIDQDLVIAHAGERRVVFPFEILEPDGATVSSLDGRWVIAPEPGGWSHAGGFEGGRGFLSRGAAEQRNDVWLSFILKDGEVFRFALDDIKMTDRYALRMVRGDGRKAARRLQVPAVVSGWPDWRAYVLQGTRWRWTEKFDWFHPGQQGGSAIAAWQHGKELILQTGDSTQEIGAVLLVTTDGRIARQVDNQLVVASHVAMQPVKPQELIDQYALPNGAMSVKVSQQIQLPEHVHWPDGGWIQVDWMRLRRVEHFGWRLSLAADSSDQHQALPAQLEYSAPDGARSRLILAMDNVAEPISIEQRRQ